MRSIPVQSAPRDRPGARHHIDLLQIGASARNTTVCFAIRWYVQFPDFMALYPLYRIIFLFLMNDIRK